jgi:hypothetical protein
MFGKLEDDLVKMEVVSHRFAGTVTVERSEAHALVVLGLNDRQGENILTFWAMSKPGAFELTAAPEPMYLFAFDDLNKDLKFQAGEPYGWAAGGEAVDPLNEDTDDISILIVAAASGQPAFPQQLLNEPLENHLNENLQFNVGTVSSLDNPWFSEEQAKKGLWEPYAFMEDGGSGIHFLEPYDPYRIPVLFVHGVNGTPRNFATLIEQLDQSKFQAWIYSYPSGVRLSLAANGIFHFVEILHRQYGFDELHLIAHSMGGLVSRGTLNRCVKDNACEYLRSYTTLSTPWNGVASAASGVKWAPTVVPVWRDLDPSSEYVTTLFDTPLPDGLPYYLMFGYQNSSIFGSGSSDGVIVLSSQLRDAAQEQAQMVRGYDEGHVSILSNEAVIRRVYENLSQSTQQSTNVRFWP